MSDNVVISFGFYVVAHVNNCRAYLSNTEDGWMWTTNREKRMFFSKSLEAFKAIEKIAFTHPSKIQVRKEVR